MRLPRFCTSLDGSRIITYDGDKPPSHDPSTLIPPFHQLLDDLFMFIQAIQLHKLCMLTSILLFHFPLVGPSHVVACLPVSHRDAEDDGLIGVASWLHAALDANFFAHAEGLIDQDTAQKSSAAWSERGEG